MIKEMNENELQKLMEEREVQGKSGRPFELPTYASKDALRVCLEMRSEDGTNFLQAVGMADLYETRAGMCGKVLYVWVAPECRRLGYGGVMAQHLAKYVRDFAGDVNPYVFATVPKSDVEVQGMLEKVQWQKEEKARVVTYSA